MPTLQEMVLLRDSEIDQARRFLRGIPSLTLEDIPAEEHCPICLLPLAPMIREGTAAKERSSSEELLRDLGAIKLDCGHVFCRQDIVEWMETSHGSCPTCRSTFFTFTNYAESEYESSDGGEYVPGEDDMDDASSDIEIDDDMMPSDGVDFSEYSDMPLQPEDIAEEYEDSEIDLDELEAGYSQYEECHGSESGGNTSEVDTLPSEAYMSGEEDIEYANPEQNSEQNPFEDDNNSEVFYDAESK